MSAVTLTQAQLRDRVHAFERDQMKKPQVEIRVEHVFFPGGYARTMYAPAGTDLTGAIHKYHSFNILKEGELLIIAENGPQHIKAPYSCLSPPGTKRAAQTLTDVVWTTVLATDLTDVAQIESQMITNSEQEYLAFVESEEHTRSAAWPLLSPQ